MSLLRTQQEPAQAGFFSSSNLASMTPNPSLRQPLAPLSTQTSAQLPGDPEESNQISRLPTKEVEKQVRAKMTPKSQAAMEKFMKEGANFLFGPDSHYRVMKGIEKSKDVGGDVGRGVSFVVDMLIKNSTDLDKNEEAQAAVIPAGTLLVSDIAEYLNERGIPFTEDDYAKAMDIFNATIQGKYNPAYKAKMDEYGGSQAQAPVPQEMAPAQGLPPEPLPRASLGGGGGLLNRGG